MQVILITTPDNIESPAQEMDSLPQESLRNCFDGTVYRCYMPGSNPPVVSVPVEEVEE